MTRGRRGWAMVAAMLPLIAVNLINVVRSRARFGEAWPVWRPMVLDLTLVVAVAILVAAVAFGFQAWRRGAHA